MNALEASLSPYYFIAQVRSDEEWRPNTSKYKKAKKNPRMIVEFMLTTDSTEHIFRSCEKRDVRDFRSMVAQLTRGTTSRRALFADKIVSFRA